MAATPKPESQRPPKLPSPRVPHVYLEKGLGTAKTKTETRASGQGRA